MKHLIFDFDGTLADSMPVILSIAEEMLGIEITEQEIQHYRNMTAKQVLKEAKIPLYRVPGLLVKGKTIMSGRVGDVTMFDDFETILKQLSKEHKLYVVSSNGIGIITSFLKRHKVRQYFTNVYGNVGLFSKAQALKKVMKREGFSASDAMYVGDEVRDIEAARKVGLPIISVTWGYNGEKILKKYKPTYLVDSPKQIIDTITNA